jgi:hypothetical protein
VDKRLARCVVKAPQYNGGKWIFGSGRILLQLGHCLRQLVDYKRIKLMSIMLHGLVKALMQLSDAVNEIRRILEERKERKEEKKKRKDKKERQPNTAAHCSLLTKVPVRSAWNCIEWNSSLRAENSMRRVGGAAFWH